MKTTLLLILLALLSGIVAAQTLTVKIGNIKDDAGQISVAVYNLEKEYMKKPFVAKSTKAVKGAVEIVIEGLAAGTYAITIMHDANDNKKLDSNLIGIPKEGFGFSNNAMGSFGPPSFDKAKFEFTNSSRISIDLKYL